MTHITVKREVLEQAIEDLLILGHGGNTRSGKSVAALRSALEQAKDVEPVAWWDAESNDVSLENVNGALSPLYTLEQIK